MDSGGRGGLSFESPFFLFFFVRYFFSPDLERQQPEVVVIKRLLIKQASPVKKNAGINMDKRNCDANNTDIEEDNYQVPETQHVGAMVSPIERSEKNRRSKWSQEEEDALCEAVKTHGSGKWAIIKKDHTFAEILRNRDNVSLKDKWRNLQVLKEKVSTATNEEEDINEGIGHVNPPASPSAATSSSYLSSASAKPTFDNSDFNSSSNQVIQDLREAQKLLSQYKHNDPVNSILTHPDPDLPEISSVSNRSGVKSKSPRGNSTDLSNLLLVPLSVNKRSNTNKLTIAVTKKRRLAEARPSSHQIEWTSNDELDDDLEETVSETNSSNDVSKRKSTSAKNRDIETDNNQVPETQHDGTFASPPDPSLSFTRVNTHWSQEEEDALCEAVKTHGSGKWAIIKKDYTFAQILRNKDNVSLKDKWRNMNARNKKTISIIL